MSKFNHTLLKISSEEISEEFSSFNESDSLLLAKMNDVYMLRVSPGESKSLIERMTTKLTR